MFQKVLIKAKEKMGYSSENLNVFVQLLSLEKLCKSCLIEILKVCLFRLVWFLKNKSKTLENLYVTSQAEMLLADVKAFCRNLKFPTDIQAFKNRNYSVP